VRTDAPAQWTERRLRGRRRPHHRARTGAPRAATIFTAIEEELGLKLDRDKGSREFIVIDRIAHPSPN
jgi:uncharacterized protein (TIGR03435 family)